MGLQHIPNKFLFNQRVALRTCIHRIYVNAKSGTPGGQACSRKSAEGGQLNLRCTHMSFRIPSRSEGKAKLKKKKAGGVCLAVGLLGHMVILFS